MDKFVIKDLQIETIVGIYDWEKEVKQVISLDIEIDYDIKKASRTDNLKDTLNYKKISKRVISLVEKSRTNLIERLAEKVANTIIKEFKVKRVKLFLKKTGALRGSELVGVKIVRPWKTIKYI